MQNHLDAFALLADEPLTSDQLIRRFMIRSGADLERRHSVKAIYYNAQPFLSYLTDIGRLTNFVEDGFLKYVRTELADPDKIRRK